jgi:hypothetical protein
MGGNAVSVERRGAGGEQRRDGVRLEMSWGGGSEVGQKTSWSRMKLGLGGRKEKGKQSLLRTRPN